MCARRVGIGILANQLGAAKRRNGNIWPPDLTLLYGDSHGRHCYVRFAPAYESVCGKGKKQNNLCGGLRGAGFLLKADRLDPLCWHSHSNL